MVCDIKIEVVKDFGNLMNQLEEEQKTSEQKRSEVDKFLRSIKQKAIDSGIADVSDYLEYWSRVINKRIEKSGMPTLEVLTIQDLIQNPSKPVSIEQKDTTTGSLLNKKEFKKDFAERIYGTATQAKKQAIKEAEFNMCNSFFFDRQKGTMTLNEKQLNDNIKEYQQRLLDTLFNYLKGKYSDTSNRLSGTDYSIFDGDSVKMYIDGKYTRIFEQLFNIAQTAFGPFTPKRLNTEFYYQTEGLKAFNAFQTLLHFDEFLRSTFGEILTIRDANSYFSDEKSYSVNAKATSMFWNTQSGDDIDLTKSVNNISKLMVQTTRMYDFNSGNMMNNQFVTFGEFISVITKLHNLAWDQPLVNSIKLNSKKGGVWVYDLSSLSQSSQNYIRSLGKNATLGSLINRWTLRPEPVTTALFELLSSPDLREKFKGVLKKFTGEDKNVLLSLSKELFGDNENSLKNIQSTYGYKERDYLGFLLQTIDSTWMVKNCQYYENNEQQILMRSLLNSNIDNIKRQINDNINIYNNPEINKTYKTLKVAYNKANGMTFNLSLNGVEHTVRLTDTGNIFIGNESLEIFKDKKLLLSFVDLMTGFEFSKNPKYLEYYKSVSDQKESQSIVQLFTFATELLHGQYTVSEINRRLSEPSEGLTKREHIEKIAKDYYSGHYNDPKVKDSYSQIDIIPDKQLDVMTYLAETKALNDGAFTATQVNDSEGKALGTSTPSRLLSTFQTYFEILRNNSESPASHFLTVSDPNTIVDIQTVREFKTQHGETKTYNAFNTREFIEGALLYDFIAPLTGNSSEKALVNGNVVAFTPSVNSDKSTVSKMFTNLLPLFQKLYGNTADAATVFAQFIKDPSDKLIKFINDDLGSYYSKMITKIGNDLVQLSESSSWKERFGNFVLEYNPESFKKFNALLTPEDSARDIFDAASRETGVQYNEQLHVIFGYDGALKKDKIMLNNSIFALYHRYNGDNEILAQYNMPNSKQYWQYKNAEVIQSLLKNKVDISLVENEPLTKFLEDNGLSGWINDSGKLVFAKYKGMNISNMKTFENIFPDKLVTDAQGQPLLDSQNNPVYEKAIDNIHEYLANEDVELNPIIEKYNLLEYLYTQEFVLSTVGSHVNHPYKKASDNLNDVLGYIKDEAGRFQAQHKRNVSNTASMHKFLLDRIDGIPEYYNIATIEDIRDCINTITGVVDSPKPFDGATFVNPWMVHLENNSLYGEKAGIHKKQFVHFYDERLGTGGIIKTAGFGITNSLMNNSPFMERVVRNMTDRPWMHLGKQIFIDITKGNQNSENDPVYYDAYFKKPIKDSKGVWKNQYFKIKKIDYKGKGLYDLVIQQVSEIGQELPNTYIEENVSATTNYEVWKNIFKGKDSVGFSNGRLTHKGMAGESSILNTVKAINACGFGNPVSQTEYYQPMKHSDTHYLVTEGAIKQGTANFNTKKWYYKEGNKEEGLYNHYRIRMLQAGIQLDKEHHADNSEISMMTQVISALAALGNNWDESNKAYRALAQLAQQGTKHIVKPLLEALQYEENPEEFQKTVATLIVKQLANGSQSSDGVAYVVAQQLIEKYRRGENITISDINRNPIAISSPVLFDKVQSMLSSMLTSQAIKLKFSGILSVLVPSHEIMKVYDGRLKGDFVNFEEEIKELQAAQQPIDISQVQMGRTYHIVDEFGNPAMINIAGATTNKVHLQTPIVKKGVYGDPSLTYVGYYDLKNNLPENYRLIEDVTNGRNLAAFFCTFNYAVGTDELGNPIIRKGNFYDLDAVKTLFTDENVDKNEARSEVYKQLDLLQQGKATINNQVIDIVEGSLNIQPYELVMPKTMAEKLGLTPEDNLYDLVTDKKSFTKKFLSNLANKVTDQSQFTVALKNLNGKHMYIADRKHFNTANAIKLSTLEIDSETMKRQEDGKLSYIMASLQDEIYIVDGQEVIVTDDVMHYVNNMQYNTLYVSEKVSGKFINTLLKRGYEITSNKALRRWRREVLADGNDLKSIKYRNSLLGDIHQNEEGRFISNGVVISGNFEYYLNELGDELYTSFEKSLDIIAARIPAQCMQSFMPMRVVGYEDFDINTAYVNTMQIFLQGSDYDIDAVSLLTFELGRNGKFVGWSPEFDLSSKEHLKISTELDYPTFQNVKQFTVEQLFKSTNPSKELLTIKLKEWFSGFSVARSKENVELRELGGTEGLRQLVNSINNISRHGILDIDSASDSVIGAIQAIFRELFNWEIAAEQVVPLFKQLIDRVDTHNFYNTDIETFTKNYIVEQMFRISTDLRNLRQAHQSVDVTTKEPKSIADNSTAGKAVETATPGNFANKYQSIEDNHVGKDVIGISAVGLKSFFAITQYVNTILNTRPIEEVDKLLNKPITFAGEQYFTIANSNPKWDNETRQENMARLIQLQAAGDQDQVLMISALLSLATDNAKELCLAKLNANASMAGMYIYGLTMGIPFKDLGKLLMSDIGNEVASYLKGSIISGKMKLNTVEQVLKHFENPATQIKQAFGKEKMYGGNPTQRESVFAKLDNLLFDKTSQGNTMGTLANEAAKQNAVRAFQKWLDLLFSQKTIDVADAQSTINYLRNKIKNFKIEQNKWLLNDVLDQVEEGIRIKNLVSSKASDFQDFVTLHKGAQEMKTLGQILGANQGIKNTFVDYVKYVNTLEETMDGTTFTEFMTDPAKRQEAIDNYEKRKVSFNILDIITTVPHYAEYLQAVFDKHGVLYKTSIAYRTVYSHLKDAKRDVGFMNLDKEIKALRSIIDRRINDNYLNDKYFYVPAGQNIVNLNSFDQSEIFPATELTKIYLGSQGGNATFKNLMEQLIIPDLKEGYNTQSRRYRNPTLANNEFIKSLGPNIFTKNPSRENSISFTSSVNMSPRSDEDRLQLELMRQAFDSLTTSYTFENGYSVPIKELFFWYNLVAYNNKQGQGTLTKIFDNYQTPEYNLKLYNLDNSNQIFNLEKQEMINWLAQLESPYSSYSTYLYFRDREALTTKLMRRVQLEKDEEWRPGDVGQYDYVSTNGNINPNLILHRPHKGDVEEILENGITISYNHASRKIASIKGANTTLPEEILKELNNKPEIVFEYQWQTDTYKPSAQALEAILEQYKNCNK